VSDEYEWILEEVDGGWRLREPCSGEPATIAEVDDGYLIISDGTQYYPSGSYSIPLWQIDELASKK
jgi:hypothetical protein